MSFKVVLVEDDELDRRSKRTARDYCLLFSVRLLINIFVLITLAASGYSIYQAAQQSLQVGHTHTHTHT